MHQRIGRSLAAVVMAGSMAAAAAEGGPPADFKEAMQSLNQSMLQVSDAVMREDYGAMAEAARFIAEHPRPPLQFRKRVMGILGPDAAGFKAVDHDVHQRASDLAAAAEREDLAGVMRHYLHLNQGCVDCHTAYRDRVRKGLAD